MTEKELYVMMSKLQNKPHKLVVNNSDYFRYEWEDGTTEEVYFYPDGKSRVFINGKYVYTAIPR